MIKEDEEDHHSDGGNEDDDVEAPLSPGGVAASSAGKKSRPVLFRKFSIATQKRHRSSLQAFLWFNFVLSPALILLICILLGAILAAVEGWSFANGFFYVAGTVAGVAQSTEVTEMTLFGEVAEIVISILALTLTGAVVGLASIMSLSTALPEKLNVRDSPSNAALVLLVFIPVAVLLFCAGAGGLFALTEGWAFRDGFEYLVQTVCGLSAPLTLRSPEGDRGRVISLVFAISSLGITSVIVGLIGAMALCEQTIVAVEECIGKVEAGIADLAAVPFTLFRSSSSSSRHSHNRRHKESIDHDGGSGSSCSNRRGGGGSCVSSRDDIDEKLASPRSPRDIVRANVQRRKSEESPAFNRVLARVQAGVHGLSIDTTTTTTTTTTTEGRVTTSPLCSPNMSPKLLSSSSEAPSTPPSSTRGVRSSLAFAPRELGSGL